VEYGEKEVRELLALDLKRRRTTARWCVSIARS
jgi:hypothetical protein